MSLDTKYRPRHFYDVLGQESHIKILRRFVATNRGRHQSYLFAGPFGSGKTTLGRILARALLCSNPLKEDEKAEEGGAGAGPYRENAGPYREQKALRQAGDPCDECSTCKSFLQGQGASEFIEVDAATNTGKDDIVALTDEIQFSTFSGRHRIYLFDEAHRLSSNALDALLKPLEETTGPKSQEKRLVCIFCTTEPEKMSDTILSRCAPAFVVEPVPPRLIADRMAHICRQEGIEFDPEMLQTIAEVTESHIRDALKAVEGISLLGTVNQENTSSYLHLERNTGYLNALEALGTDLPTVMGAIRGVLETTSPVTVYRKLGDVAMMAYQAALGGPKPPVFWDRDRIKALHTKHGEGLLGIVSRLSSRPAHPTASMLYCDLAMLHHSPAQVMGDAPQVIIQSTQVTPAVATKTPSPLVPEESSAPSDITSEKVAAEVGNVPVVNELLDGGIYRGDLRAVRKVESSPEGKSSSKGQLSPAEFSQLLALCLQRMDDGAEFGPPRRLHLGSP